MQGVDVIPDNCYYKDMKSTLNNITVRTRLPEHNMPENMRIENEGQLLEFLEKREKHTSGKYYAAQQVREHFDKKNARALA